MRSIVILADCWNIAKLHLSRLSISMAINSVLLNSGSRLLGCAYQLIEKDEIVCEYDHLPMCGFLD